MDGLDKDLEMIKNFTHISYSQKIAKAYTELLDTNPDEIIKWWRREWDWLLGWIYWGKIYLVWADTGIGKSTFVNQVARNVAEQWWKVIKYSLEDRMEDLGKEELYYECNRLRYAQGKSGYEWIKFVNNEYYYNEETKKEYGEFVLKACDILSKNSITELDKSKQVNIEELCYLMEEQCDQWAKMFFIDHLHYFEFQWTKERLDIQIQNIMHRINEIARRRNVAVMIIAHYKYNKIKTWEPSYDMFKDGSAIKQVANIIIQIEREEETSCFHITKMRWPIKPFVLETTFNLKTYEYAFKKYDPKINSGKGTM